MLAIVVAAISNALCLNALCLHEGNEGNEGTPLLSTFHLYTFYLYTFYPYTFFRSRSMKLMVKVVPALRSTSTWPPNW